MNNIFNGIKETILQAGDIMVNAAQLDFKTSQKINFRDIVTNCDVKIQQFIKRSLLNLVPDADFIGEEDKAEEKHDYIKCFIVDPIDGTVNFKYGIKKSSCSIAYVENGIVEIGVVYDPYLNELFYAIRGQGAYLNGNKIHAMQHSKLKDGLAIFGTNPYFENTMNQTFELAKKSFERCMDLRRFGSAALDLCYVAAGRAVIFFEGSLAPWDIAAGMLIANEAGVICRNYENQDIVLNKRQSLVAGNKTAVDEWFECVMYK